jgi:hypothetical protein
MSLKGWYGGTGHSLIPHFLRKSTRGFQIHADQLRAATDHLVAVCQSNARYHRDQYQITKDRYHYGQWKAYWRIGLRLGSLEILT